ncbi:MAG: hypothetical protein ABL995_18370 [Bryobacteraceae bacterium]
MFRTCAVFSLLVFTLIPLTGQGLAGSDLGDPTAVYIAFLTMHCQAAAPNGQVGSVRPATETASRLGVQPDEVMLFDRACLAYLDKEAKLRDEALRRHHEAEAAGNAVDIVTVKSFTDRRAALAASVLANLNL